MAVSKTVDVKVPKRSGFDKSFQNLLTTKVGTLTPILVDEVIPNSVVDLDAAISASLPPLASDTFMRCDLKAEAFFVPNRLIYGGYEDWLTGQKLINDESGDEESVIGPVVALGIGGTSAQSESNYSLYKPGTLMDYLGFRAPIFTGAATTIKINPYPVLAYHRIYDDWYRNTQVQTPLFTKPIYGTVNTNGLALYNLPWVTYTESDGTSNANTFGLSEMFFDGSSMSDLRQRNFGLDYFTTATPNPQDGDAKSVTFSTTGSTGEVTIAALRAANSLQQFAERNALAGRRLQDYVKAHYGANLSSGVAQRSVYLGSATYTVYSKGISQTAESSTASTATNNPFGSVGAQYGRAFASGNGKLIDHFEVAEPGIIMVLVSLVPKVSYASGIDRILTRYTKDGSQVEMADPLLQNVGNQPIFTYELAGGDYFSTGSSKEVFGYTDRFAEFKTKQDQVHGLLRDGENLQSFALQRTLINIPKISSSTFLPIPTNYLDQVAAVNGSISQYGVWIDSFFDYKVSMPLAEYSIPSLQDPAYEHGNDVKIDIRGSKL